MDKSLGGSYRVSLTYSASDSMFNLPVDLQSDIVSYCGDSGFTVDFLFSPKPVWRLSFVFVSPSGLSGFPATLISRGNIRKIRGVLAAQ